MKKFFIVNDSDIRKKIDMILDNNDISHEVNRAIDITLNSKTYNYYDKDSYDNFLKDLYVLINFTDMTPSDIAPKYDIGVRSLQNILTKYGWELTKKESQRRATIKRDYSDILKKGRMTRTKSICGSNIEDYIRYKSYDILSSNIDGEVIVGINSSCFLDNRELDIPIIIIKDGEIQKITLEVNGDVWHNSHDDNEKKTMLESAGYIYTGIDLANNYTYSLIDNLLHDAFTNVGIM